LGWRTQSRWDCTTKLRAGRRQNFQPVFFPDLHHARNVLLLLRDQRADLLRKPQDALQLDKMEIAAKRHKRRKTIQFLCFLCLFAAQDPVFYLAA
jgi:hypothetical protein